MLEDITVFENKSPIIRLVIHRSNDVVKLLVISEHDVRAIAVERCSSVKSCKYVITSVNTFTSMYKHARALVGTLMQTYVCIKFYLRVH